MVMPCCFFLLLLFAVAGIALWCPCRSAEHPHRASPRRASPRPVDVERDVHSGVHWHPQSGEFLQLTENAPVSQLLCYLLSVVEKQFICTSVVPEE